MKAVIIGAGSAFGSRLSVDILSREPLQDSTIALCDIDQQRLDRTAAYVRRVIDSNGLPATLEASTDRRAVLPDADIVVLSVSIGGPAYYDQPYEAEIDIPWRYGVVQAVGDTLGPGGLFRALRTAPELLAMVDDIDALAPGALILNYTNPMAILTWVLTERAHGAVVGLCHGVTGNARRLAGLIDADIEACSYTAAGINHMTWFLRFESQGRDVLPQINERVVALGRQGRQAAEPQAQSYAFRADMVEALGYLPTESDRHFPEYVPYYQHDDVELYKRFYALARGVKGKRQQWYEDMGVKAEQADSIQLVRSHESMSGIMEARRTGTPFTFSGNVMNAGYITNLPTACCVEVPVTVDADRIQAEHIGGLPLACAALCRTNINFQEMAVRAVMDGSRQAAFEALLLDPITGAGLSPPRIRQLFDELWAAEDHLLTAYS